MRKYLQITILFGALLFCVTSCKDDNINIDQNSSQATLDSISKPFGSNKLGNSTASVYTPGGFAGNYYGDFGWINSIGGNGNGDGGGGSSSSIGHETENENPGQFYSEDMKRSEIEKLQKKYYNLHPDEVADYESQLTAAEKAFFEQYPNRKFAAFCNKKAADINTFFYYNSGYKDNTNSNAFKHALWSAFNARSWGGPAARQLGEAHENGSYGSPNMHTMDLHNNNLGIDIMLGFDQYDQYYGSKVISAILNAIHTGKGKRLLDPTQGDSPIIATDATIN